MKNPGKIDYERSSTLLGILVVLVAVVTLEVGSLFQYYHTRLLVEKEAYRRAQDNIDRVEQDFALVVDLVESAVHNNLRIARNLVNDPEALWDLTGEILEDNPMVYGSAVALVEKCFAP